MSNNLKTFEGKKQDKQGLQIFKNEKFGQIRALEKDGEPWFVAKDISNILGFRDPYTATRGLDEDEKCLHTLCVAGQNRETTIVNEPGLYSLILKSHKPEAKQFKRWIAHEVIPAIRKHGAYLTPEKVEEVLLNPDTIIQLATQLKEERNKRLEAERFNKQIAISENSLLVREVAKVASKEGVIIGEKRLWNKLRDWGMVFKNSTEPKQQYVDRGYFEVTEGAKETYKGTFTYRTTRVTGKGQVYIIKKLLKDRQAGGISNEKQYIS